MHKQLHSTDISSFFLVIAIDIDPNKIELAKNNAEVYGVSHKIDFILGDFFQLAPSLKADAVFLSPPWGGMTYSSQKVYDLEEMLQPAGFSVLFAAAEKISKNIAAFLPKNSDTATVSVANLALITFLIKICFSLSKSLGQEAEWK